jgi:thiamine-monophosphate kinase
VIALTLDRRLSRRWLAQFHRGLAAAARRFGIEVVGGDVAQGKGFSASLTLLGIATSERVLTRRGARRGDHIFVTGVLGGSLKSGHHWRFTPRLAEGAWLVRQPEVRSMMDVSDGLAKDLHALEPANAEAAIEAHALPIRAGATLRQALSEGEDYDSGFHRRRCSRSGGLQHSLAAPFPAHAPDLHRSIPSTWPATGPNAQPERLPWLRASSMNCGPVW